jgi:hypothetical protein
MGLPTRSWYPEAALSPVRIGFSTSKSRRYHHNRTMFSIEMLRSEHCFLTGTLRFQYTGIDDTTIKQCSISKNKSLFFFVIICPTSPRAYDTSINNLKPLVGVWCDEYMELSKAERSRQTNPQSPQPPPVFVNGVWGSIGWLQPPDAFRFGLLTRWPCSVVTCQSLSNPQSLTGIGMITIHQSC